MKPTLPLMDSCSRQTGACGLNAESLRVPFLPWAVWEGIAQRMGRQRRGRERVCVRGGGETTEFVVSGFGCQGGDEQGGWTTSVSSVCVCVSMCVRGEGMWVGIPPSSFALYATGDRGEGGTTNEFFVGRALFVVPPLGGRTLRARVCLCRGNG